MVLRLNGRVLPPTFGRTRTRTLSPSEIDACAGSTSSTVSTCALQADTLPPSVWWVSEIDTEIPWHLLPRGTHYISAALVDGAQGGGAREGGQEGRTGRELPGGNGSIVAIKIDALLWPPLAPIQPSPSKSNFSHEQTNKPTAPPPSESVKGIHSLEQLLVSYSHFHHGALQSSLRVLRRINSSNASDPSNVGEGAETPLKSSRFARILLYTPPDYGW